MRGMLTLAGLLVALGVASVLVRKQMVATRTPVPSLQLPAKAATGNAASASDSALQQSQQMQQQYKQAIEGAIQARQMPDDK